MPITTLQANTPALASDMNNNFTLCVLTDTVRTISVSHVYTASQTLTGGFAAGASSTIAADVSGGTPIFAIAGGSLAASFPSASLGADTTNAGLYGDAQARWVLVGAGGATGGSRYVGTGLGGTIASPSATLSGTVLVSLEARGYGAAYTGAAGSWQIVAKETWTGTSYPTNAYCYVTAVGATSAELAFEVLSTKAARFYGSLTVDLGTTLTQALTYGGVQLNNAVTGTGNMVLSISPTFTGTVTAAAVTATGSVATGTPGGLATNATDGFLYFSAMGGIPSGTPTAFSGRLAMTYDATNNKLYVYNGAWKSVTLS